MFSALSAERGAPGHEPGVTLAGVVAAEEAAHAHPGQAQLLAQLVEHHEKLHRQRALQDSHACEWPGSQSAEYFYTRTCM